MNFKIFSLLLITICLCITRSHAENCNLIPAQESIDQVIDYDKIYVTPDQIHFSINKIFVQTSKGRFPISELSTDEIGIYYRAEHPYSWICNYIFPNGKKCGHYNTYTYFCENCGRAPGQK